MQKTRNQFVKIYGYMTLYDAKQKEGSCNMKYEYLINVRDNDILRENFNQLTRETFVFDFNDWYQRGFWKDRYIPHVLLDGDTVIANVSVNELDFMMNGQMKHLIQLGTVMTNSNYRMQGLGKFIMDKVLEEYQGKVDGIYLFGNDSVLNYYPKFGFKKYEQFQYYKSMSALTEKAAKRNEIAQDLSRLRQVDMSKPQEFKKVLYTIQNNVSDDQVLMVNNAELDMFYLSGPMQEMVYEIKSEGAYVVLEKTEDTLSVAQIFSDHQIDSARILDLICEEYAGQVKEISLGFTPAKTEGWECRKVYVEDSTFWGIGDVMQQFEDNHMMFPVLSHA